MGDCNDMAVDNGVLYGEGGTEVSSTKSDQGEETRAKRCAIYRILPCVAIAGVNIACQIAIHVQCGFEEPSINSFEGKYQNTESR